MKISKYALLTFYMILTSCVDSTISQVNAKTSIWEPVVGYDMKKYDSTLILAFEENFNDSVEIYMDNKLVKNLFAQTNKSIGVVPLFPKIEEIDENKDQILKIVFLEKNEEIHIDLQKRYSYVYLSRDKGGGYFVEYSNFKRTYY